ncbi:hypothetical protein CRG98_039143 [Punica granatum]|uniref:Rhodanese-like domain-containing protein 4, chloroplastic n=1 Tax=Punica granatum TaxID=22663 RepID=A0A2I0I938_PUNGR|nr:hypothetical protein CRG98_039143 [Punica granatum]
MGALNAAGLTPISVLSDGKRDPRKSLVSLSLLPPNSPLKLQNTASFAAIPSASTACLNINRSFHGGLLLLLSSLLGPPSFAQALTYEEALQQAVTSPAPEGSLELDASGALDSVVAFVTENPLLIAGGAAVLLLPLVLSRVLQKPKPWGTESAKSAYAKLGDDLNAQLLDIRPPVEFRQVGSPDIRGLGKKPVPVVYRGGDKPGFLKKLSLKFKEPENTTLFILDKFDGNSELVAELVTVNGFKAAYAIKDGAEGPRGWMNSGLPWIPPKKALSLDFSNLTEAIGGVVGDGTEGLPVALGIAAATGLGLLAFSEVETILQLLGSAALVQFFSKKLLFAEDRKATLQQVDEFLNTKVAPEELVDEIKQIGKALLPSTVTSKALPAATGTSAEPVSTENTAQKAEATPEPKAEVPPEPAVDINSVPKPEVKAESFPGFSRPLSPYPYYPDLKPPASPTPSQPRGAF